MQSQSKLTKLCHISVGQKIRLTKEGVVQDEVFMVVAKSNPDSAPRTGKRSSLSYEKAPAFLVSMRTGETSPLPRLASLVELVSDEVPLAMLPPPPLEKIALPGPALSDERLAACVQILEQGRHDRLIDAALAA